MIEADRVQLLQGEVAVIDTPTQSGKGQRISRCPKCEIAVWSNYAGAGDAVRFVRVGTLDEPCAPASRHPYFHRVEAAVGSAAPGIPAEAEYYRASERWPAESLERRAALQAKSPKRS